MKSKHSCPSGMKGHRSGNIWHLDEQKELGITDASNYTFSGTTVRLTCISKRQLLHRHPAPRRVWPGALPDQTQPRAYSHRCKGVEGQ